MHESTAAFSSAPDCGVNSDAAVKGGRDALGLDFRKWSKAASDMKVRSVG